MGQARFAWCRPGRDQLLFIFCRTHFLLLLAALAFCANNPDITIEGILSGANVICSDRPRVFSASLLWPSGVSHPVSGTYLWSPGNALRVNGQASLSAQSNLDIDLQSIGAVSIGHDTLKVSWRSDSGSYSMPEATSSICVIGHVSAPVGISDVTYTRGTQDCEPFGLTSAVPPAVDVGAYTFCDDAKWKIRVTSTVVGILVGVNMGRCSQASVEAATAENWKNIVQDIGPELLKSEWHMREAILAHEEVHVQGVKNVFSANFAVFQQAVERLSVDMACGIHTAGEAKNAIMALPAYETAKIDFWVNAILDYRPYRHPYINSATDAATLSVTMPVVEAIIEKAIRNGWE